MKDILAIVLAVGFVLLGIVVVAGGVVADRRRENSVASSENGKEAKDNL